MDARHCASDPDQREVCRQQRLGPNFFQIEAGACENPEPNWIRADRVFEAIVDFETFEKARAIIVARSARLSDEAMLDKLADVLARNGYLSGIVIDEADECPSSCCYASRFGTLLRAYALVGFVPDRDYRYLEINRTLRRLFPTIVANIMVGLQDVGGTVTRDAETDLLTINDEFTASVLISRCFQTSAGTMRWKVRLDTALRPDLTVLVRMDPDNIAPYDYYLLPLLDMREAVLRLCDSNGLSLDAYRCESLSRFYVMAARTALLEVA